MKQLKFMLAAATAISLATAAQAGATDATLYTENFDSHRPGKDLTEIGFSYKGGEGENASDIVEDGENDYALNVNTGTDPLLLQVKDVDGSQLNLKATDFNYLNIDTMVQFTVTPETDTVLPGLTDPDLKDEDGNVVLEGNIKEDKLLIYLQEKTVGETKSNVLTVWASEVQSGGNDDFSVGEDKFVPTKVEIPGVEVLPKVWYRLQVKTYVENDIVLFSIKLGETELASSVALYADATKGTKAFPSLLGKTTTLSYVGFAGEGSVDDLVVTKNYNAPDAVDFTFVVTWDTGISAVAYTISEDGTTSEAAPVPADGFSVPEGATVELAVTLKDSEWTRLADGTVLKFENVAADNENINLTTVKIAQKEDANGNVVVNENATVEEIKASAGITEGYFAGTGDDAASKAEFQAVLNWKKNKGGSKANINSIDFTAAGDPEGDNAKAYLLDCDVDAVATEEAKFVFTGFDPANGGAFTVGSEKNAANGAKYGNGKVEVRGKAALSDTTWSKDCEKPAFFKAFLVK